MKHGIKDVDWEYFGALLARSDDNGQSSFLKSFVKECLSWGTKYQVEQQLASVNLLMSEEEKDVLGMITYTEGN